MALSLLQRALLKSSRYLAEAFSEPGLLRTFEEELFHLKSASCVSSFQTLTDVKLGGQSTAHLEFQNGEDEGGCLVFKGDFSTVIPPHANPKVRKLGQASFGSKEELGSYLWLGDYERQVASTLNCRVKGDGRIYGMYLKTDSYFEGDGVNEIWQAHFRTTPDTWEDVKLAVVQFVLTRDGYLTEEERIPNLRRVTSIGFSVMGGSYLQEDGPYQLCVSRIAAGYDTDRSSGNED